MSFESAPTPPTAETNPFDFRDANSHIEKQAADQAAYDEVAAATYAAETERTGKAGGVFDFSEQKTSEDHFDFSAVNHEADIARADEERAEQIVAAKQAVDLSRAGKAGGVFDFSQGHTNAVAKLTDEAHKLAS